MPPANVYQLSTTGASFNQGVFGKSMHMRRFRLLIVTPLSYFLTPAQVATSAALKTKLQADAINADPDARIRILGIFGEANDNAVAPKVLSFGYGGEQNLYGGQYKFTLIPEFDDLFKFQKMQALNGHADEFLIFPVDEYYNMVGTKGIDGSGNTVFRGLTVSQFLAGNIKIDAGDGAKQTVDISLGDAAELNNGNLMIIPAGFNIYAQVKNVTDVELNAVSALTTGVVSIAPIVGGGVIGTNLAEKYPTALADITLWVPKKVSNAAALTITSIGKAVVNGVDAFTFTFVTTTPYPTSGNTFSLELTTPALLVAAGIIPAEVPEPLILAVA